MSAAANVYRIPPNSNTLEGWHYDAYQLLFSNCIHIAQRLKLNNVKEIALVIGDSAVCNIFIYCSKVTGKYDHYSDLFTNI